MGYKGADPNEYAKHYDLNKEGFVKFLRRVGEVNDDPQVKEKVDSMVEDYKNMMDVVKGNRFLLQSALKWPSYDHFDTMYESYHELFTYMEQRDTTSAFRRIPPPLQSKRLYEEFETNADVLSDILVKHCKNHESLVNTLNGNAQNDEFWKGKNIGIFDENNEPVVEVETPGVTYGATRREFASPEHVFYAYYKARQKMGLSVDLSDPDFQDGVSQIDEISHFTESHQKTILFTVEALKQCKDISFKDYQMLVGSANNLLGKKLDLSAWKEDSRVDEVPYILDDNNSVNNAIYSNMIRAMEGDIAKGWMSSRVADYSKNSSLNKNGADYSGNFDYYSSSISEIRNSYYRLKSPENDQNQTGCFASAEELNNKIDSQLNAITIYSKEYLDEIEDYYNAKAKATGLASGITASKYDDIHQYTSFEAMGDSPISNIVRDVISDTLKHVPKMASKPQFQKTLDKHLGWEPFNFKEATAVWSKAKSNTEVTLKAARQKLFERAAMSVQTLPQAESDKMQYELTHEKFDYAPGEKTTGGHQSEGKAFKGRRTLFNTPMFKINNTTLWKKRYEESKQKMIDAGVDPKCYEEHIGFHGCAYWSLPSIIGRAQGWFMGAANAGRSGFMLGVGAYFGTKFGKCWVYCGNDPYACTSDGVIENDDANGAYVISKFMMGENIHERPEGRHYKYYGPDAGTPGDIAYTAVYADMGSTANGRKPLNDFEVAIKRNELILPEYFVDVSARKMYANVAVDKDGNYYEWNKDYDRICRQQKRYLDAKVWGTLKPTDTYPEWDGSGYTPKWDKNGKRIGMDELA